MGGYSKRSVVSLVSLSSVPWTSAMAVIRMSTSSSTEASVFMYVSAAIFRGICVSVGEKTQLGASAHTHKLDGKFGSDGWCLRVQDEAYLPRPSCFWPDLGALQGEAPAWRVGICSSWEGQLSPHHLLARPSASSGSHPASQQPLSPAALAFRRRQRSVRLGTFKPVSPGVSLMKGLLAIKLAFFLSLQILSLTA